MCFISFSFPPTVKFHYAKPTISFNMHVSREPQDDGYTVIPESKGLERSPSEKSLTLESSSDVPRRMKSPKQVREHAILLLLFYFSNMLHVLCPFPN